MGLLLFWYASSSGMASSYIRICLFWFENHLHIGFTKDHCWCFFVALQLHRFNFFIPYEMLRCWSWAALVIYDNVFSCFDNKNKAAKKKKLIKTSFSTPSLARHSQTTKHAHSILESNEKERQKWKKNTFNVYL